MKVLIVDDETNLVRHLVSFLGSFPEEFSLHHASTGEEGFELLQSARPDILVTDVRLPGIDGIELLRQSLVAQPTLKVIVMTAFSSPELRKMALREGAVRFIEKPLDLNELRTSLHELHESSQGWSGLVGGLDIFDIAQIHALTGKSKALRVSSGDQEGILVFAKGTIVHASTGTNSGDEGFFEMARWQGGTFDTLPLKDRAKYSNNITLSTTHLIMEAARLRDESGIVAETNEPEETKPGGIIEVNLSETNPESIPGETTAVEQTLDTVTEVTIMAMKELLQELAQAEGFKAAAVFMPTGEMLEGISASNIDMKIVGSLANNALLNAQKATDAMGVGRGNMVQIRAPQAIVIMRCLNEATDFAMTASGKAHVHMVVVMDPEGNVGMASIYLDKVIRKVADEVR